MLTPEQARKELEKIKQQDWIEVRLTGLGRLPERLWPTARTMLGIDEHGAKLDCLRQSEERAKLFDFVPTLGPEERVQLFESLFPGLGRAVDAGWQLHDRFPYQTGHTRKPFRAAGQDKMLSRRRIVWLTKMMEAIGPYSQPLPWLAVWAAHFCSYEHADAVGILLAAAIDQGDADGDQVFETLCASARGKHEIGGMGRHVARGLLCASRPGGWEVIEKLLLAAQREEGLRQVILETVDEAHPEAFRRMLRLIRENDLARFSATVRAVNTWFGFGWDVVSAGVVNSELERVLKFLDDSEARNLGVLDADAETAYLALWATAFDEATAAITAATELLKHREPAHRFVAVHLLAQLNLAEAMEKFLPLIDDDDIRVAVHAMLPARQWFVHRLRTPDVFASLERLFERLPVRKTTFEAMVWPWTAVTLDRSAVCGAMLMAVDDSAILRLTPYLDSMDSGERESLAYRLSRRKAHNAEARRVLLRLAGDPSKDVRYRAASGLEAHGINDDEAIELEALLTRSNSGVRSTVLTLLLAQNDASALASADRLLAVTSAEQRRAGLELLRQLVEASRSVDECRARAAAYREAYPTGDDFEQAQLSGIGTGAAEKPTLENGLRLLDESLLTRAHLPPEGSVLLHSPTTARIIAALDELLWTHRETVVEYRDYDGQTKKELLANLRLVRPDEKLSPEQDRDRFALAGLCENWWMNRGPELRDADGFELLRIKAYLDSGLVWSSHAPTVEAGSPREAMVRVFGTDKSQQVRNQWLLADVVRWLCRLHPAQNQEDYCLLALESILAQLGDGVHMPAVEPWLGLANVGRFSDEPQPADLVRRLWNCRLWLHQLGLKRHLYWDYHWQDVRRAYLAGVATDADVVYLLLAKRDARTGQAVGAFEQIWQATSRHGGRQQPSQRNADLDRIVGRIVARIVEVELTRGEAPTAASVAALQVARVTGVNSVVRLLIALDKDKFVRTYDRADPSRASVFSHLIYRCRPAETDTPGDFAAKALAARIPEKRLVELAVYAPQWVPFAEHALGWPGLTEAVLWIHAHTRTGEWTWRDGSKEFWHAGLSEHTALTADDLVDGAVDVAWFRRVHDALGGERWVQVYAAAKYACTGAGHARARLFADAMLGMESSAAVAERIKAKRHQDSVRALGLLPLPDSRRDAEVLARYQAIQEFMRGSKQFGAQRRTSELRAAEIGLENLARSAGYADPLRLQWAMEARVIEYLAEGPVSVTVEGATVSLGIDPWGEVELTVVKDGKRLADVPAKLKKQPDVARLREHKVELKRQASRVRPSLEQFMVRGDEFTGAELRELMEHPLLRPMLANLVLIGDGIAGYPVHGGKALEDHRGEVEAVKAAEKLRIAHPHDLLPAATWHRWQKDCFARERIQPFKQVFREFYPVTAAEKEEGTQTRRYAGHQVQPRQALALLGQRGWVHHPEEGVRKVFHDAGLVAWLHFQEGFYTPAEIEGLTLEGVFFTKRGEHEALKLTSLPPRLFSETMRDLDLVVST